MTQPASDDLHSLAVLGPAANEDSLGCLQGYCTTTFETLLTILGQPHIHMGDKTTVEWAFRCQDGTIFTVYDWKLPNTPVDEYHWHIGGRGRPLQAFERFTGLKAVSLSPLP